MNVASKHQCPLLGCDKSYQRKQQLDSHISKHFGAKQFQCLYCEKAFVWENDCKQHGREVHLKTSRVRCSHCQTIYGSSRSFQRHLKQPGRRACKDAQADPVSGLETPTTMEFPPVFRPQKPFSKLSSVVMRATTAFGLGHNHLPARARKLAEFDNNDCDDEIISPFIVKASALSKTPLSRFPESLHLCSNGAFPPDAHDSNIVYLQGQPCSSSNGPHTTHDPVTSTLLNHLATVDLVGVVWQVAILSDFCLSPGIENVTRILEGKRSRQRLLAWIYQSCLASMRAILGRVCRHGTFVRTFSDGHLKAIFSAAVQMGQLALNVSDEYGEAEGHFKFLHILSHEFVRRRDQDFDYPDDLEGLLQANDYYKPCIGKILSSNGYHALVKGLKSRDFRFLDPCYPCAMDSDGHVTPRDREPRFSPYTGEMVLRIDTRSDGAYSDTSSDDAESEPEGPEMDATA